MEFLRDWAWVGTTETQRQQARTLQINFSRAVTKLLQLDSGFVQQRQQQVRHRSPVWILNMAAAFETSADDEIRQWEMIVKVAVAHIAAEQNDRIVQERTISIGRGAHLLEKPPEQFPLIDLKLSVFF